MTRNPITIDPEAPLATAMAVMKKEQMMAQEIFLSETARFAHVVLPAAASVERTGSFTNTDRRVQLSPAAIPPPGDARPDWWIIAELGKRLRRATAGAAAGAAHAAWGYAQPAEVMDEIAALTPIYGGITHARLGYAGIQWPCPTPDHPGTPILHVERASRGPVRFVAVSHQPPAESSAARYPLGLRGRPRGAGRRGANPTKVVSLTPIGNIKG
jgi:predicted molibdopterin-dependent oxidoreductase YjgC